MPEHQDTNCSDRLLVNIPEGARRLSISPRSFWQMLKDGRIPTVRVGRRTLVDPRDLTAFIDSAKGVPDKATSATPASASRRALPIN